MYEELIQRLGNAAGGPEGIKMAHDAAVAIAALQTENAEKDNEIVRLLAKLRNMDSAAITENGKLQAALSRVEAERDAALDAICAHCQDIPCRGAECEWWRGAQGEA